MARNHPQHAVSSERLHHRASLGVSGVFEDSGDPVLEPKVGKPTPRDEKKQLDVTYIDKTYSARNVPCCGHGASASSRPPSQRRPMHAGCQD